MISVCRGRRAGLENHAEHGIWCIEQLFRDAGIEVVRPNSDVVTLDIKCVHSVVRKDDQEDLWLLRDEGQHVGRVG